MSIIRRLTLTAKLHKQLITNTFTNGFLLASGDFVVQQIERYNAKHDETQPRNIAFVNWKRTAQFFITGFCFGPVLHGWYTMLDATFPLVRAGSVAIKVIFDQVIAGPVCVAYFYTVTGLLEGKPVTAAIEELKRKFLATYVADCVIYPVAQTVNFFMVPPRFRVIYVSTITFFHSIFLSFMKTSDGKVKEFIDFIDKTFELKAHPSK